jgi:energy-coupling factor transport system ATP-binding protein
LQKTSSKQVRELQIIFDKVNYVYSEGTAFSRHAIKDISFSIQKGEFIGLIGHTGSGKSTLIQHMNGLMKATSGHIYFNGEDIYQQGYKLRDLRSKVGLVFQYPEHQLFETTIFKDVIFGPTNLGIDKLDAELRAYEALKMVGIGEELLDASPFELSGGQKRRVAIAGVLAMKPEVLILDEPTAGLDPRGRDDILEQIAKLHAESGITIILVTHSMEDIAKYADRLFVMNQGELVMNHPAKEVFIRYKELEKIHLAAPQVTYLMNALKEKGYPVPTDVTTVSEAKDELLRILKQ